MKYSVMPFLQNAITVFLIGLVIYLTKDPTALLALALLQPIPLVVNSQEATQESEYSENNIGFHRE